MKRVICYLPCNEFGLVQDKRGCQRRMFQNQVFTESVNIISCLIAYFIFLFACLSWAQSVWSYMFCYMGLSWKIIPCFFSHRLYHFVLSLDGLSSDVQWCPLMSSDAANCPWRAGGLQGDRICQWIKILHIKMLKFKFLTGKFINGILYKGRHVCLLGKHLWKHIVPRKILSA